MKKLLVFCVVTFVIVAVGVLAKDKLISTALRAGVKAVTGLQLDIRQMHVGLLRTNVSVKDLRLFNPAGFSDSIMVEIPELYVDYDLKAILNQKIHLRELKLNLKEFMIVRNAQGHFNLESLKAVLPENKGSKADVTIDDLQLRIDKVVYKDYSRATPRVREFNVKINEHLQNITGTNTLLKLVLAKA